MRNLNHIEGTETSCNELCIKKLVNIILKYLDLQILIHTLCAI
jgi:hypothetical protein